MIQNASNKGKKRSIYRDSAVIRYGRDREKSVLPRLISPGAMIWLWIFLGLLSASGLIACLVRIPAYASGQAIVIEATAVGQTFPGRFIMVAFLPADSLSDLRVGQNLFVSLDGQKELLRWPLMIVEPEVHSPDKVRERFLLSEERALAVTKPVAVAIAQLGPLPSGMPASRYAGGIYRVDVEVGSRRLISLLSLDHLWRE